MRQINLILAFAWVAMAVVIFTLDPDKGEREGFPFSMAWIAVLFAGYNLVRWWSIQMSGSRAKPKQGDWRRPPTRRAGDDRMPDPTFDFSDSSSSDEDQNSPPPENGIKR